MSRNSDSSHLSSPPGRSPLLARPRREYAFPGTGWTIQCTHGGEVRLFSETASPSASKGRLDIRHFDRPLPPDRGPRMNDQIRISPIRVIGAEGEQLGVMPTSQALERAREAGL